MVEAFESRKAKVFQVILLENGDNGQGVEVQEGNHIDYMRVRKHLQNGGSVFITSKNSEKLIFPGPPC